MAEIVVVVVEDGNSRIDHPLYMTGQFHDVRNTSNDRFRRLHLQLLEQQGTTQTGLSTKIIVSLSLAFYTPTTHLSSPGSNPHIKINTSKMQ